MNKDQKGQILYGTLIPIFIILAILAGSGYFLLKNEIKLPKLRKEPTEMRRLEGFPTVSEVQENIEKQKLVITSKDELNTFLNQVDPRGKKVLNEEIDFNKEIVIAVSSETNETFGYSLKIDRAYLDEEDESMTVEYVVTKPDETCDEDKVPNVAFDLVAMSKTDMNISFEKIQEEVQCDEAE